MMWINNVILSILVVDGYSFLNLSQLRNRMEIRFSYVVQSGSVWISTRPTQPFIISGLINE